MDNERYMNQSILRALDILEAVGDEEAPISLSQLGRKIGLHKSTVHRLVLSLESRGWLARNAENGKYRIGVKCMTVGKSRNAKGSFEEIHPLLVRLAEEVRETAILSVWDGNEVVCVDLVEAPQKIHISSRVGSSFPIYTGGTGFAVLTGMPEEEAMEILDRIELKAYTPLTLIAREEIRKRYREAKERGYVTSMGQVDPGVMGIAVPISIPYERYYGSIGVVLPDQRADEQTVSRIIQVLKECAGELQNKL